MADRSEIRLSDLSKQIQSKSQQDMADQEKRLSDSERIPTPPPAPRRYEPGRNWITCHVLDTTTGRPAVGIICTLRLISPNGTDIPKDWRKFTVWKAKTDDDGRVKMWGFDVEHGPKYEIFDEFQLRVKDFGKVQEGEMLWSLTFDTGRYFGKGNTFYPEVEVRFATKVDEEHYHVPLLLGPWSYTTYRGS